MERVQRLRALDGICSNCVFFKVENTRSGGLNTVKLQCDLGYSPLNLYFNTPLGQEADCSGFSPNDKVTPST